MAMSRTSAVYVNVIGDVIDKVRKEFDSENGPGINVLQELQYRWQLKMMTAGAILPQHVQPVVPVPVPDVGVALPGHDLNVRYDGTGEYETPTAELLFPPTPIQTPIPGTADSSMYNFPTGLSDYPTPYSNEVNGSPDVDIKPEVGRPSPYMDLLTRSSGKRKCEELPPQYQAGGYIPQQDGAGDSTPAIFELEVVQRKTSGRNGTHNFTNVLRGSSSKIPKLDGPIPDPDDHILSTPNIHNYQGVINDDYSVVNTPAPDMKAGTSALPAQNDVGNGDDDDEPPLNENDDEDPDESDEGEELNTTHLVLAQFDKVTHPKRKWKCTLNHGIMRINDRDILFNKASGAFDF